MATNIPLSEFPLFRNLPEELLDKVAAICEEAAFSQGESVFREGDKADKLHFLLEGVIVLKVKLTSRPESITVSAVNQRYEGFGWSGIVPPYPLYSYSDLRSGLQSFDDPRRRLFKIFGCRSSSRLHRDATPDRVDCQPLTHQPASIAKNTLEINPSKRSIT